MGMADRDERQNFDEPTTYIDLDYPGAGDDMLGEMAEVVEERDAALERERWLRGLLHAAVEIAEGRVQHNYMGACPDDCEGHDSRDPDCYVCDVTTDLRAALAKSNQSEPTEGTPEDSHE